MPTDILDVEPDSLRFITCGSVDDGKSTLIGRLLWESKLLYEDQQAALIRDSKQYGTQGEAIDFALLVDGLQAEREQGITIDVAYRFFSTARRRFLVADTPGHEQYTRNMATGASTAQLAVILVDARKGILVQTRRHSRIVSMLGIRHVLVAVNKMDLVDWDEDIFRGIRTAYLGFAQDLNFKQIDFLPISALTGENIVEPSPHAPWSDTPPLLTFLESVDVTDESALSFCLPVQWVNRPNHDFRGFCGRIADGQVSPGDRVRVSPSGVETTVRSIVSFNGPADVAIAGESVTLMLADEIDASRGDVIAAATSPIEVADQFEAQVLWMSDQPLTPGRLYGAKIHNKRGTATVTEIKHRIDVNTGARLAAKSLSLNEIAVVNISLDRPAPYAKYDRNRTLGAFILMDRLTHETVAAGMIHYALRRAANIHWQAIDVNKQSRAELMHQRPRCIWFTGLSGSGKSTIANLVDKRLHASGFHTYVLDGDNVRHGLNRNLGFTEADRAENIRRVAEVARLMVDAGLVVIVSFISPFRAERALARGLFEAGEFVEVFVDAPLSVCEQRDPKGLYAKARAGQLPNFTGYDSPYEAPETPDILLDTTKCTAQEAAETVAIEVMDCDFLTPVPVARNAGGAHLIDQARPH